jgi:Tfp pilus assembly protein PilO
MSKNQKGDVVVIIVVVLAFIAVLGLGFWAIFSSKQRSSKLLNDKGAIPSSQEKQPQNAQ